MPGLDTNPQSLYLLPPPAPTSRQLQPRQASKVVAIESGRQVDAAAAHELAYQQWYQVIETTVMDCLNFIAEINVRLTQLEAAGQRPHVAK